MSYTEKEVQQYVAEEDVKFIRLAFCDIFGTQKNISIMPGELEKAFRDGISFDASAIRGFGGSVRSDLFLHPDPSTLSVLPWRPEHGRVVRMYCNIKNPDGSPFELDTRRILSEAVKKAKEAGCEFGIGAEFEFYLFKTDENGAPTSQPYDGAGYMDIAPIDKGENVRREICLTLERMGMIPESSHHEEGPGQNEIDFRYSDPLSAADNALTFKSVVRTIAARNGLFADFSPKPLPECPGNGMHVNISVKKNGVDCLESAIAGIIEHISEITVFLNPTPLSYSRLGVMKAPKYISWSDENRSQLIRLPAVTSPEYRRAELRSPDPAANPYLALALIIYAALDGIERGLNPPERSDENMYSTETPHAMLPASLDEAAVNAKNSDFVKNILSEKILAEMTMSH